MKALEIGAQPLTLQDLYEVSVCFRSVTLSAFAKKKIKESRQFLEKEVDSGKTIYGVNTGFGILSNQKIQPNRLEALQVNLLRSHACGVGNPLEEKYVRAMLLLRANALSFGSSGVRVELLDQILLLLNKKIHPFVPTQGSVGASGDLAPLAHLALPLIGEGEVIHRGKRTSAAKILKENDVKPLVLKSKEGLALINGTQFMTAIAGIDLHFSNYLLELCDLVGALSVEALRGSLAAFSSEIHRVRPHRGQQIVASRLRRFLKPGNKSSEIMKSHRNCDRVQDPYSLRCIPQVHGASRDALKYVEEVVLCEMNSVTDNPLVFPESGKIISGGNFHGQYVAMALDFAGIALSEFANISEQRIQKLINPMFSDLPAFLTEKGGLNSGLMIVQVAAASLVSENKTLAHPASVDSIPTSTDKEDHVSMGAWAANKYRRIVENSRKVIAMEILAAGQAIDLLRPLQSTEPLEKFHKLLRRRVSPIKSDRIFYKDIEAIEEMIVRYEFLEVCDAGN